MQCLYHPFTPFYIPTDYQSYSILVYQRQKNFKIKIPIVEARFLFFRKTVSIIEEIIFHLRVQELV
jgi:hypothetical protein